MLQDTGLKGTAGQLNGGTLVLSGMLGMHAAQLVALAATVGWLCPRVWAFLYDVFVLRPVRSAALAESICQICSTHWYLLALATAAAVVTDWLVMRRLLQTGRLSTCVVYCVAVVLCVLLLQGFVLYGLGSASLQVHGMVDPTGGLRATEPGRALRLP